MKTTFPIVAHFGPITDGEVDVMLGASDESGSCPMATAILAQRTRTSWPMTLEQAEWLAREMVNEAPRVSEACGDSAGAAFERAGNKLLAQVNHPHPLKP